MVPTTITIRGTVPRRLRGTDLHRLHAFEAVIKEKVKKKGLGLSVEG